MNSNDLALIGHDPAAFEAFYRRHVEGVQGFVARRVRDPQLVADLTAEVFLAAIDAAASYDERRGAPIAWLFGIARNVVSGELRRAGRERRAHAQFAARDLLDPDDLTRMQERIDAAARARELYEALAVLPDGERAAFELHALDGLTPAEVAVTLGIRPVTARVRLYRARSSLRGQLFDDDTTTITQPMEA